MQYLIFGGNGLVGKSLQKELSKTNHSVAATSRDATAFPMAIALDITNRAELEKVFSQVQPNVVINATNLAGGVDFCENNPDKAKAFHFEANKNIGELCLQYNARMVLISTDYVFDGTQPPYRETDAVCPLNTYGKEKLAAEEWMQSNLKNYCIARTTNVFGWDPLTKTPNFLMSLYFKLSKGEKANAPSFLWGNPTHVSQLSKTILELCEKEKNGIYHIVGSSYINRYEWAKLFCEKLNFDLSLLVEQTEIPTNIAPRPFKSNLSIENIQSECTTPAVGVIEGLELFREEMAS